EAHVRRDAIQPRPECRPALEPLVGAPGANERLLDRVLGLRRTEHAVAVPGQLGTVLLELTLEPGRRTLGRPGTQCYAAGTGRRHGQPDWAARSNSSRLRVRLRRRGAPAARRGGHRGR